MNLSDIDDAEREQWVMNDALLYQSWTMSGWPMARFIREKEREIDVTILLKTGQHKNVVDELDEHDTIVTLHVSKWLGLWPELHVDIVTPYERKAARDQETGIPYPNEYGDSQPVRVVAPDGWRIVKTDGLNELVNEAGTHVILQKNRTRGLIGTAIGAGVKVPETVRLPEAPWEPQGSVS